MAGSDTIVGIVGALVLVAVMAGVFVYEYNNPPATGGGPPPGAQACMDFEAMFPGLACNQDIDQDGLLNLNDTDIDGDGVLESSGNDAEITVTIDVSKSFAAGPVLPIAAPGDSQTQGFYVGNGSTEIMVTLQYTVPVAGQDTLPSFTGSVAGGEPFNLAKTTSGTTVTMSGSQEFSAAGDYMLTITQTSSSVTPATVSGTIMVHYGSHSHPM